MSLMDNFEFDLTQAKELEPIDSVWSLIVGKGVAIFVRDGGVSVEEGADEVQT